MPRLSIRFTRTHCTRGHKMTKRNMTSTGLCRFCKRRYSKRDTLTRKRGSDIIKD